MPNPGRQLPPVRHRPPQPGVHRGLRPPEARDPRPRPPGPGPTHPSPTPVPRKHPNPLMPERPPHPPHHPPARALPRRPPGAPPPHHTHSQARSTAASPPPAQHPHHPSPKRQPQTLSNARIPPNPEPCGSRLPFGSAIPTITWVLPNSGPRTALRTRRHPNRASAGSDPRLASNPRRSRTVRDARTLGPSPSSGRILPSLRIPPSPCIRPAPASVPPPHPVQHRDPAHHARLARLRTFLGPEPIRLATRPAGFEPRRAPNPVQHPNSAKPRISPAGPRAPLQTPATHPVLDCAHLDRVRYLEFARPGPSPWSRPAHAVRPVPGPRSASALGRTRRQGQVTPACPTA
jgi:hypothetical protein